jgi:hypothetical protein
MQTSEVLFMYNNLLRVSADHADILKEATQRISIGIAMVFLLVLLLY